VLIFPGATEIAMELRAALGQCKEVELFSAGADVSNHAPFVFRRHLIVPSIEAANWLPSFQALLREHRITHIFPAHDDALLALAEHAGELDAKVVTSPLATCRTTRSKSETLRHLRGTVPTPLVYEPTEPVTEFPVFVKPDRGQGAQGTCLVHSAGELELIRREHPDRIALEYLPGEEFTVDCFSDRERGLLFASGRIRRRIRSGIAMDSTVADHPEFVSYAQRIHGALPLHGAWFYQVKRGRDGVLKLMEVAPRIGGTSALSRVRGVNLPLLSLYEADRLPCRVISGSYSVEIDRALHNRYRHNIDYRTIYVDFDDTLVVHGRLNFSLIQLLYQALSRGVKLVLVTRHGGELDAMLRTYRLAGLFDQVVHLRAGEAKADFVRDPKSIFIDDSFAERTAVQAQTGVAVFAPDAVELLLDDRL
jgi:carbamoyl-phosphate synthase large subunit